MFLTRLIVDVAAQEMALEGGDVAIRRYRISTSASGVGSEPGSYKTPLGLHRICQKIGEGLPWGAELKSRQWTGVIWSPEDSPQEEEDDDLILSRVLWLEGMEPSNITSRDRYIYIHGTNHEGLLGSPASHGCVRMANADMIELFGLVSVGTEVYIYARTP